MKKFELVLCGLTICMAASIFFIVSCIKAPASVSLINANLKAFAGSDGGGGEDIKDCDKGRFVCVYFTHGDVLEIWTQKKESGPTD